MIPQWIIEKKRDGHALSADEINAWIQGLTDGSIPDYQITAWAMAVYLRGMTTLETAALTQAMMNSGESLDLSEIPFTADKHSTGGIGDKISIPLAPLVAAVGVHVPMISGRGLGITGGTLDKLETIPGFDTRCSNEQFIALTQQIGACLIGQTATLAPADKRLYALRDVSGTVPSIPLITASIMSKKLAEGAKTLVFDVKCGSGAFMRSLDDAKTLAQSLVNTGTALGRTCQATITNMDQPLGRTIGNALEIRESIEILRNHGPADVRELTLHLATQMAHLSGCFPTESAARQALEGALASGAAFDKFKEMVIAQGGDPSTIDDPSKLPQATYSAPVPATQTGYIARVDAEKLGRVALQLGAGRTAVSDPILPGAGIDRLLQQNESVTLGEPLMTLWCDDQAKLQALIADAQAAITYSTQAVGEKTLFLAMDLTAD